MNLTASNLMDVSVMLLFYLSLDFLGNVTVCPRMSGFGKKQEQSFHKFTPNISNKNNNILYSTTIWLNDGPLLTDERNPYSRRMA